MRSFRQINSVQGYYLDNKSNANTFIEGKMLSLVSKDTLQQV